MTRDFYENTREFINKLEIGDDEKFDLNMQLYTYVKSPVSLTIGVEDFADSYLDVQIRDNFNNYMKSKNTPETLIQKGTQYLENRLKHRKIKFTNDVSILVPSENFKELVEVLSVDQNVTTLRPSLQFTG